MRAHDLTFRLARSDDAPRLQAIRRAAIDVRVLLDFETKQADPGAAAKRRLLETLEAAGAVFIFENGGGLGVRLKSNRRDVRAVNKWEAEGGPPGEDDI